MKAILFTLFFLFQLTFLNLALAGEDQAGKISGLVFGDYYYLFSNHDSEIKNMNGLWFRRIYFTYDQELAQNISMRFRLEMAHPGDFSSKNAAVPFVKDAYLKYRLNQTELYLGISPTPTFSVIEKIWGYRSVEKTPADFFKLASSRETGLAVKGKLSQQEKVFYHVMFGNGNGQKSETNKYKKLMAAVGYNLTNQLLIEGYADYEQRSGNEKRYTYQGFAGFKSEKIRAGFQYLNQMRTYSDSKDVGIQLISAFFSAKIKNQFTALVRLDKLFDKLPEGPDIAYLPISDQSPATLAIVGIDYSLNSNVHLIPNLEMVSYDDTKIDNDLMGRVTFYYKFK